MPENTVSVTRPGRWGNPNTVARHGYTGAITAFERDLRAGILNFSVSDVRRELRGKNLACFCPLNQPCHGDILLEIANEWTA